LSIGHDVSFGIGPSLRRLTTRLHYWTCDTTYQHHASVVVDRESYRRLRDRVNNAAARQCQYLRGGSHADVPGPAEQAFTSVVNASSGRKSRHRAPTLAMAFGGHKVIRVLQKE